MSSSPRQRVVFVGIDGATWEIIEPMVAEGKLPNLAAMMRQGAYGPLTSTMPPNSSLAWASFQTGVHPGKHGVFFFREQHPGSYERPVIQFSSIQAPTIWKTASDAGLKVASCWVPLTYPPEELNGINIGGLLTPDERADFVTPIEKRHELEERHGRVPSDNEPELMFHTAGEEEALASLLKVTEEMTEIGLDLLQREDPDLFGLVFRGVDLASHQSWWFQDPEWAAANPAASASRKKLLASVYEAVDASLGRFRDAAQQLDGEVVFACCSDHGFGSITHRFYINRWLEENGWLVLKPDAKRQGWRMLLQRKWQGLLRRTGIARKRMEDGKGIGASPETLIRDMIDWSKTKAYSSFSGGEDIVLINLKGREPEGTVEPGEEYESLRTEIIEKLKEVRAEDGTSIIARVFRRGELWEGPQVHLAPDIQYITRDTAVNSCADPLHPRVVEPALEGRPAMHRLQGVYLLEGSPAIQSNVRVAGPQIADMGATLLHLLGLPLDDHLDGKVMEECLDPQWLAENPIQTRIGVVELKPRVQGTAGKDDERLIETMRALGYME
ncbi:MAG: alkaline phosphatase family protein [Planctomycetes bacterium]|nr:alkaline phosphatase family protein [Planctomycetota bacterium]